VHRDSVGLTVDRHRDLEVRSPPGRNVAEHPTERLTLLLTRAIEDLDVKLHSPDRIEIVIVDVPCDGDPALRTLDGFPLESKKRFVWSREALRGGPSGTREAEGRWEERGHCDDQHATLDVGEALHDKGSFYHE